VADLPFTERELRFLRELGRSHVRFLIVGLSAAALQGAPVVTQDVDLWFHNLDDPQLAEALRRVGGAYVPPTPNTPPMFAGEGLELFDIVLRKSPPKSVRVVWARCGAPLTPSSAVRLRSRFCPMRSLRTRIVSRVSSEKAKALAAVNHPNIAADAIAASFRKARNCPQMEEACDERQF
jgi:hypothetical protein